jgi:hypothetical protein
VGDDYEKTLADIVLAHTLVLRGAERAPALVADMLPRARSVGDSQVVLPALVVAAAAAAGTADRTELVRLLAEIEPLLGQVGEQDYIWSLPEVVRLAVWCDDLALADRVVRREPSYASGLASSASARATILEARGELVDAVDSYADAVRRWEAHGHVVERAYALLGLGRSRLAAGDGNGTADVLAARAVFADLKAVPLVAEADRLVGGQQRLTS